jgi:hypothetical protein
MKIYNQINVLDWRAMSPDMSTIEHVWDDFIRRINARIPPPRNVASTNFSVRMVLDNPSEIMTEIVTMLIKQVGCNFCECGLPCIFDLNSTKEVVTVTILNEHYRHVSFSLQKKLKIKYALPYKKENQQMHFQSQSVYVVLASFVHSVIQHNYIHVTLTWYQFKQR